MRTIVITGSESGIGLATKRVIENHDDRVIGVDIRPADITIDLTDPGARAGLAKRLTELGIGTVDGVSCCAGVGGSSGNSAEIAALNWYGAIDTVAAIQTMLDRSDSTRICMVGSAVTLDIPADDEVD